MHQLWDSSHIAGGNSVYLEALYEQYLEDPNSIHEQWRRYFDQLPKFQSQADLPHSVVKNHFRQNAKVRSTAVAGVTPQVGLQAGPERKQLGVAKLITAYRQRGHKKAQLDPLGIWERDTVEDLELGFQQLSAADEDTEFDVGDLNIGTNRATLKEIVSALESIYCSSIGVEAAHITNTRQRKWIQHRLERSGSSPRFTGERKKILLRKLIAAEGLEKYLASKYPGTKRFGLEGGESLVPILSEMIQVCGEKKVKEIVFGMAHRGRLNVLINLLGKNPSELFDEFEGRAKYEGSSDVKYHQGFSSNVTTRSGSEVHLALAFNPSHLEIVAPVIEGSVRARQDRRQDMRGNQVVPIIMHGDSAFAGQGVVMETFQMSQTRAYGTGGSIHVVINNQVGFTTNKREDVRSTEYCTEIAKMVQAPIFHVNGDDPEACLYVAQLAADFRMEFNRDVVIDLVCYRRHGNNEADEPSGTQPMMYNTIRKMKTTCEKYATQLEQAGVINSADYKAWANEYRDAMDRGDLVAESILAKPNDNKWVDWSPYIGHEWTIEGDTSYPLVDLKKVGARLNEIPEGFLLQRQTNKIYEDRKRMAAGAMPINWGFAELLAYGSLLEQGYGVRITGQDSGRGTFSHRHAIVHSQNDGTAYMPLSEIAKENQLMDLYDSFLSEEAVLAFEYGYATTEPNALVIWEAQFGDFANGAQVVIDQFITSGELKWSRLCGLTMLLPHGYEGQGPEHSSARLERFMQLCAEQNIQVCVPTTPAQTFHMLRRQAIRPMRKPLVVMTPKSLLRHKAAVSTLEDLAHGYFQTVISEHDARVTPEQTSRMILCSGKVYYELLDRRETEELFDTAIVRIEQLYPFPDSDLLESLKVYAQLKDVVWCQEEPQNQGCWYSSLHNFRGVIDRLNPALELRYAGREASASPAAGYAALHVKQQEQLIKDAFQL
ncbi:MAG: 2-oxoglutarate dehydrogenase E1 component [Pseudomonadota bacterium]